jgi:DNA mismatch repair protein MutS2
MDKRVLEKLEFTRVRELLSSLTACGLGRELAKGIVPLQDETLIKKAQQETTEAKSLLRDFSQIPLGGIHDVRKSLKRARLGAILDPGELLELAETLDAGGRLKEFLLTEGEDAPLLQSYAEEIRVLRELQRRINISITDNGEVADGASEKLFRLRRQIRDLNNRVRERLDGMIRSSHTQKYLQEPIVTMRGDRHVVPVKAEYRNQVPGIVHDQSASGVTLFIEPMAVLELNNRLRGYKVDELREIERILAELSGEVAGVAEEIGLTLAALGRLDLAFAKGSFSLRIEGIEPKFNKKGFLDFRRARHPLLEGDVVPIDVHLGRDFQVLVITGPNTGGKTVTLKTIGLLALMAQAGLHLPADAGTETTIFDQVLVDIGDEQSIEQNLSTFSGHLKNIIKLLEDSTANSLVLLDELGAGTDPTEGAALGMAILHHLYGKGSLVVATTHYSELKTFAYSHEGMENASVEFNSETLQPTYRLLIGIPGRSNAFDIAEGLGLSAAIVGKARNFISSENLRVEDLIKSLEEDRIRAQHDRTVAERTREELEGMQERYAVETSKLKKEQRELLVKARQEALFVVNQARREAEEIIADLKKNAKDLLERERSQVTQETRQRLHGLRSTLEKQIEGFSPPEAGEIPKDLKPGEDVYITHLNQKGYVLELISDEEVSVQVGIMKVTVDINQVRRVKSEEERQPENTGAGRLSRVKAQQIPPELDLRGQTADEAIYQVEKYLDDAYLAGLDKVVLIHGKGTGVLREVVGEFLAGHAGIRSFRLGNYREGGTGVTIVEFVE